MVKNEQGQIALVYYQPTPRIVTFGIPVKHSTKRSVGTNVPEVMNFAFVVQHAVSLCWVDEEYVDRVLAVKVYCCQNSAKPAFHYASQAAINVFNTGSY